LNRSKGFYVIASILTTFVLVYGISVLLRLLLGAYLMVGGITDLNYVLLALLCSVPFVLYALLKSKKAGEVILISGGMFIVLFVYVNFLLVFSLQEMTQAIVIRMLSVFPTFALLLIVAMHFSIGANFHTERMSLSNGSKE
jgi:hypothetical protein